MKSRKQLLAVAISQLGKGGKKFRQYVGLGSGQPWCDAFVYWLYNANGCGSLLPWKGKQRTYCPDSIKWCNKNLAMLPPYLARACDLIYFDWEPNGTPNHIGIVESRRDTGSVNCIEGNTSGGIVARKKRKVAYVEGIYRTHFPATFKIKKIDCDGDCGDNTVANLQRALGMEPNGIFTKETVKYLQRKAGCTPDGAWWKGTSKAVQTMLKKAGFYTGKIDAEFGKNSVIGLQKWINNINYPPQKKKPSQAKPAAQTAAPVKTTNAQKIIAKAKVLAWAYGTPTKKYDYKTGSPKAVCKAAMKKYGWADDRAEMSDCGNLVSTIVRESGVDKSFKALHGVKTPFPKSEKAFKIVHKGAIPKGLLKAGDIVRYKKTNGKQHALIYFGDGKVCEASHKNFFGVIRKDTKRYDSQAKKSTIQVLRAKE